MIYVYNAVIIIIGVAQIDSNLYGKERTIKTNKITHAKIGVLR